MNNKKVIVVIKAEEFAGSVPEELRQKLAERGIPVGPFGLEKGTMFWEQNRETLDVTYTWFPEETKLDS
jgi:hypothetical protein